MITLLFYSQISQQEESMSLFNVNNSKVRDITGLRFEMLLVLRRGENTLKGQARWWCLCDCGIEKLIEGASLRRGNSTSCGCKRIQTIKSKPSSAIDLIGQKFGKLEVISRGPSKGKKTQWYVICECGKTALKKADSLKRGKVKSCGCLELANRLHNCSKRKVKHGLYNHPLYFKFQSMVARCYRSKTKDYPRYGGRGITICKEWLEAPEKFIEWALENGWRKDENLSVDRLDNNGNYCPENCRIISITENTIKRFTDRGQGLVISGQAINISEIIRNSNISPLTIKKLLFAGYSKDDIIVYGTLTHCQKMAVGKSIANMNPISIDEALKIDRIHKTRTTPFGYTNYIGMKGRCYNPKNKFYANYGGRGIKICEAWRNNFKQFIMDMGVPPFKDAALHRINNDGDYEPSNCAWVSRSENTRLMHSSLR